MSKKFSSFNKEQQLFESYRRWSSGAEPGDIGTPKQRSKPGQSQMIGTERRDELAAQISAHENIEVVPEKRGEGVAISFQGSEEDLRTRLAHDKELQDLLQKASELKLSYTERGYGMSSTTHHKFYPFLWRGMRSDTGLKVNLSDGGKIEFHLHQEEPIQEEAERGNEASDELLDIMNDTIDLEYGTEASEEEELQEAAVDPWVWYWLAQSGETLTWGSLLASMALAGGILAIPTIGKFFNAWYRHSDHKQWQQARREMTRKQRELGQERAAELILLVSFLADKDEFHEVVGEMTQLLSKRPRSEKAKKAHAAKQRVAVRKFNSIIRDTIEANKEIFSAQQAETLLRKIREKLKSRTLKDTLDAPDGSRSTARQQRLSKKPLPDEEKGYAAQAKRGELQESTKRKIKVTLRGDK
jgi:hypothetical protein